MPIRTPSMMRHTTVTTISLAVALAITAGGFAVNALTSPAGAASEARAVADQVREGQDAGASFRVRLMQRIFKEFGETGNPEFLIAEMTDDAVYKVTVPAGTPLSGEFVGKDEVRRYFQVLPTVVQHLGFNVHEFLGNNDTAVVTGDETLLVHRSGETTFTEWVVVASFRGPHISKIVVVENLAAVAAAYS